jgi:hypothetical protein
LEQRHALKLNQTIPIRQVFEISVAGMLIGGY